MPPDHPGFKQFYRALRQVDGGHLCRARQHRDADDPERPQAARLWSRVREDQQENLRPYDGYPGMVFITAGSERQPQMIQDNGNPVDPANTMACMAVARKMYGAAGSMLR